VRVVEIPRDVSRHHRVPRSTTRILSRVIDAHTRSYRRRARLHARRRRAPPSRRL